MIDNLTFMVVIITRATKSQIFSAFSKK